MSNPLRYIGDGDQCIRGIPARDLTDDDLKALPDGVDRKVLIRTGLYAEAKPTAGHPAPTEKE